MMLQAVMTQPGKILIHSVPRPAPAPGEVLIATQRIGVCGSDIHVYHGLHPYTSYPVVQGHEVSGVIAEVGAGVTGFTPGDPVVFMPQLTCGKCYPCTHGMYHICDNLKVYGFQTDGAAQEFFPIPAEMVLKVPPSITLDQAAMVEPVAVAVHAVGRPAAIAGPSSDVAGKKVLVLGAGTIGNLVGQVAMASGADAVLISDVSEYKLAKARACGFTHTVNPAQEDIGAAILKVFGPDKADIIFECVGVQDTITTAVTHARKGSTIVIVGVFGKKPVVDLGWVQDRELRLFGTLMYQKPDYERAIDLVARRAIQLDEMITHRFAFNDYLSAYHAIEASQGNYLKVMIEL
jgi:L-iditol 2-dehydrogenase